MADLVRCFVRGLTRQRPVISLGDDDGLVPHPSKMRHKGWKQMEVGGNGGRGDDGIVGLGTGIGMGILLITHRPVPAGLVSSTGRSPVSP